MSTYDNNLRLEEIATGTASGTWGDKTNTNLELIAEAFGKKDEAIATNATAHNTIIQNATASAGRSLYLRYTGSLNAQCTVTMTNSNSDFTISKMWFIENATSGGQSLVIKSGNGTTVTVPNGQVKIVYSDGTGASGNVKDALSNFSIDGSFAVTGTTPTLTVGDGGAEDTKLLFDGNAKNYHFGLKDSTDALHIGQGTALGTTPVITVSQHGQMNFRNVTDTQTYTLTLESNKTSIANTNEFVKLDMKNVNIAAGGASTAVSASIAATAEGTFTNGANATSLVFKTGKTGTATEKVRFSSDGAIGIGGTNYGNAGQVLTSGGATAAPTWSTPASAGIALTDLSVIQAPAAGGGSLSYNNSNGVFQFSAAVPGIGLSDLSVTTNSASGNGNLSYNNGTGAFSFTPAQGINNISVTTNSASGNGALAYNSGTGQFTFTPADVSGGGGGGISLSDLSVTTGGASNDGALSYNSSNGVFTFNPANVRARVNATTASPSGNGSLSYNQGNGVFTFIPPDLSTAGGSVYTGGWQNFGTYGTSAVTNFSHGLGGEPDIIQLQFKCTSADLNYSVNDIVYGQDGLSDASDVFGIYSDNNSQIRVVQPYYQRVRIINKSNGQPALIDRTKWQWRIKCIKM